MRDLLHNRKWRQAMRLRKQFIKDCALVISHNIKMDYWHPLVLGLMTYRVRYYKYQK
jgi:hypothetical protein